MLEPVVLLCFLFIGAITVFPSVTYCVVTLSLIYPGEVVNWGDSVRAFEKRSFAYTIALLHIYLVASILLMR